MRGKTYLKFWLVGTFPFYFLPFSLADEKVEKLVKVLNDPNKFVVLNAMKKLGTFGKAAQDAVPTLGQKLRNKDKEVAIQAARVLAKIGSPSVSELVKALVDKSPTVKMRALLTLGSIGREAEQALSPVTKLLENEDPKFRLTAALVLGAMHEKAHPSVSNLGKALRDSDPLVRFVAADTLFQIGPEGLDQLLPLLKDKDLELRLNALKAVSRFSNSPKALKAFLEALQDPDVQIRTVAVNSLIRLGPLAKKALSNLLNFLREENQELQIKAFTAIMGIGHFQDFSLRENLTALNEISFWAPNKKPQKKEVKPKKTNPPYNLYLFGPKLIQKLTVILAIGRKGPKEKAALPLLIKLQKDPNRAIRAAVLLAISGLDPKRKMDNEKITDLILEGVEIQKGSGNSEELVCLHILVSTLKSLKFDERNLKPGSQNSLKKNRDWIRKALDEFPFTLKNLPFLLEGINQTAKWGIGFTEPFSRLNFKLQNVVYQNKDPRFAVYAFNVLGQGVNPNNLYWPAIQQQWAQLLSMVPLDFLILEKQQSIQNNSLIVFQNNKPIQAFLTGFS